MCISRLWPTAIKEHEYKEEELGTASVPLTVAVVAEHNTACTVPETIAIDKST
jgi:hypothetical protein